jgi:hypothetical protein
MNQELSTINQNTLPLIANEELTIAIAKSELEVMYDNARKQPRNIPSFIEQAIFLATYSEEIAASCIFSLPRKMKNEETGKYEQTYIKGKSIRLAEIILSVYKNIKVEVRNATITTKSATAIATITDLENNTITSDMGEANIHGSHNDAAKLATAAARSIALRNAIFRLIPGAFSDVIYAKAVEHAVGNQKTFPERRKSVFERLTKLGISQNKIFTYYNKTAIEEFTPELIEEIIGIGSSIKQGELKIDKAFIKEKEFTDAEESLNLILHQNNVTATSQANEYDVKEYKSNAAKDALSKIKDKLK